MELGRTDRFDLSKGSEGDMLRMLLAILPVGVVAYDLERVHFANGAAYRLLGIAEDTHLPSSDLFRFIAEEDRHLVAARRAMRARGEVTAPVTLRLVHSDGRKLSVNLDTLTVTPPPKALFLSLIEDVTERLRLDAERAESDARTIRETEALLETQKLESLGVLTGGIAHDFNNLLANVYASLAALSRLTRTLPESSRAAFLPHLTNAEAAATRAAELTRQLLAYGGRTEVERRPTALSPLVRDLASLLQVALPKKLALVLDLEDDLPAVLADPSQLRQVMMNLVTNAAEAIGEREGTVTVRTSWRASLDAGYRALAPTVIPRAPFVPDGWVVVEVADDGIGMSEEVRARIFEPFYSTKGSGRGLGLATTMGILRTHESRLSIDTEPGRGTRFEAAFPAMHHTTEPLPEPSASKSAPPEPDAKLRGRILLVDDEARARFALAFLLKNRGLEVLEAANGLEALDALAKDPCGIDAVVMDLSMPKMGGREAFAEMNARHPELPVVLTSGYSAAERMASYEHREKVFAFLEKPFREEELFTLLTKAILKGRARSGTTS